MAEAGSRPTEESLDPQDWSSLRALGHRMLDDGQPVEVIREVNDPSEILKS